MSKRTTAIWLILKKNMLFCYDIFPNKLQNEIFETHFPPSALETSLSSLSPRSSYELGLSSPAEPKHAQWQEIPNWISVNLANYEFFGDHFNLSGRLTNLLSMKAIILNYLDHVTPDLAQQWDWWGQARSTLKLMTTILLTGWWWTFYFMHRFDILFNWEYWVAPVL